MKIDVNIDPKARHPDGFSRVMVNITDLNIQRELDISFLELYRRCGIPDLITLDFLLVASLCYMIDKSVPRAGTFDDWTREIEVTIPVSNSNLWSSVASELARTVGFLTGDMWDFNFTSSTTSLFRRPTGWRRRRPKYSLRSTPNAVCLFSGGLDSLIGAINLLAENNTNNLLLIGHYDSSGAKAAQERLFQSIWTTYQRRAIPLHIRVSHLPAAANELTFRSRSLIFIALGLYAARRFGNDIPLYAPENGLIALNIPLTPSRAGSCSTRTMHPYFLNGLRSVLESLGITNPILNPFQFKTKGECMVACKNINLLKSIANNSVSCSHPNRRQNWIRKKNVNHCGYCIPCIIRRAAMHKAGIDDGLNYGFDICRDELKIEDLVKRANDLRAMINFINEKYNVTDLARLISQVANIENIDKYAVFAHRGYDEIKTFFLDKCNNQFQRIIT